MIIDKKHSSTRNTSQRLKILDYLKGVRTHPTAEMVYAAVKKDLPAISLATVYRNLNLLAELGEIIKLEIDGEFRFDAHMCHHVHCVCRRCGKIIDVPNEEIIECASSKMKLKGFELECINIIVRGVCKSCR